MSTTQINREEIEQIKTQAIEKYQTIFDALNIPSEVGYNSEVRCACPIHEGDNKTAFCYNVDKGLWRCYTHNCNDDVGSDIIGLVQKILSKTKETSFNDAVEWIQQILGIKESSINYVPSELDAIVYKTKIIKNIRSNSHVKIHKEFPFPVNTIDGKIQPSKFFLQQGFSSGILGQFMVGDCDNPHKPMYMRSFAPVLDSCGKNVIGVTGRIRLDQCPFCYQYHIQGKGCPSDNAGVKIYPKWLHYGFNTNNALYNDWNAFESILKTRKAIICESTKNVWWMEQHGIHNSVCIFGLRLLPYHLKRLLSMGTTTLILGLDHDKNEAGQIATEKIIHAFSNYFKIVTLQPFIPIDNDIAQLDSNVMQKIKEYITII